MSIPQTPTYTGYDYLTVRAPKGKEALYRDTYSNFGWQDDGFSKTGRAGTELKLKRSRDLQGRAQVAELQRTAENDLERIGALERSRTGIASIVAYTLGLIGAVFLGFSVFGYEAGQDTPSIVTGAIGIAFWVAAPLLFQGIKAHRSKTVRPQIDQRMDNIHAVCERATTTTLRNVA